MFLTHITTQGERWDSLAWRYYRDVRRMALLIEANPHIAITEALQSGLILLIPVVEPDDTQVLEELPPWKR